MSYNLTDIKQSLGDKLNVQELDVSDDSYKHVGHAGFKQGVITHITIRAKGVEFEGKSRIEAHRVVNDVLAPFFEQGLHAVSIKLG